MVENMLSYLSKIKKLLTRVVIIFCLILPLSSCKVCGIIPCSLTSSLWYSSYEETFEYFLINRNGSMIVFLGDRFHYVMQDRTGIMKKLLIWPKKKLLFINTEKSKLNLDLKNNVDGYVTIESFYNNISARDERFLYSLGFRKEDKYTPLRLRLKVSGKRYLPRADLGYNLPGFNRKYTMKVYYDSHLAGKIGKAALTPVTVAADATIIIGNVLLLPFRGQ